MKLLKKVLSIMLFATLIQSLCGFSNFSEKVSADVLSKYTEDTESLTFDNSKWNYDKDNDVYWQIKVGYCSKPETTDYETMGIYVPGAYMTGTANEDETYTCEINTSGEVNGYTSKTAPIVFPVNTPGYSAQSAPTSYSYNEISSYINAGFIYVSSGMRGRSNGYDSSGELTYSGGAPWGVTDLKAAVRYYRYNENVLPGNTNSIFTFGHSGGGAQSSLMGSTGDSELYYTYLESIGAAMHDKNGKYISDAICGAMCWCPITSLDYADEAYEWNMGQYSSTGTRATTGSSATWTSSLSKDLAESFPRYINKLGLKDNNGKILTLNKSSDGIYTSGSYYNYLLSEVDGSLNNFLSDTEFPYTETSSMTMGAGGFAGGSDITTSGAVSISNGGSSSDSSQTTNGSSKTYNTAQDYIDSLNSDEKWIEYDETTNTVKITSLKAFVQHCKTASKSVGAFDDLELSQAENDLFGNDESDKLHFDTIMAKSLKDNQEKYSEYSDWDSSVVKSYEDDIKTVDEFGNSSQYRQNMYNPMYFLSNYYHGYKTSKVAPHWRIRTGIDQGDTALTVETNLALSLENYKGVKDVDFETVWGQGHTEAERTGNNTDNFISWVNECVSE